MYHPTLGLRVIKKKKRGGPEADVSGDLPFLGHGRLTDSYSRLTDHRLVINAHRRCPRARI